MPLIYMYGCGPWRCEACARGEHETCVLWEQHWDGRGCECDCNTAA